MTQAISPVGCCLARGGQPIGMSAKKDAAGFSIVRTAGTNKGRVITMAVVPCLLLCIPLYFAFQVNRCVRPYTARTHVRRKKGKFWHIAVVFCQAVWYTQASEHTDQIITKRCVIMGYGWATVFTLAAWLAGSVLDAILGDLGLRTVFSIIVMGCCIMKYIKDNNHSN